MNQTPFFYIEFFDVEKDGKIITRGKAYVKNSDQTHIILLRTLTMLKDLTEHIQEKQGMDHLVPVTESFDLTIEYLNKFCIVGKCKIVDERSDEELR